VFLLLAEPREHVHVRRRQVLQSRSKVRPNQSIRNGPSGLNHRAGSPEKANGPVGETGPSQKRVGSLASITRFRLRHPWRARPLVDRSIGT
jgi:hypothetical protein